MLLLFRFSLFIELFIFLFLIFVNDLLLFKLEIVLFFELFKLKELLLLLLFFLVEKFKLSTIGLNYVCFKLLFLVKLKLDLKPERVLFNFE